MAQEGEPWDLLKDPWADDWETGPVLQFPSGCISCSTPAAPGYLLACPHSPNLSCFSLLTTSLHQKPNLGTFTPHKNTGTHDEKNTYSTWGIVPASQPCCLHHPPALTSLSRFTSLKRSFFIQCSGQNSGVRRQDCSHL